MSSQRRAGFTLVEIMIVVSIIALLALLALPSLIRARQRAQNTRFINSLRVGRDAFELYAFEHSSYPLDSLRGALPSGMAEYFGPTFDFGAPTPIGGNWDWDANQFGVIAGLSVVGPNADVEQISSIDAQIDDGDVTTGKLRRTAALRYTNVLE